MNTLINKKKSEYEMDIMQHRSIKYPKHQSGCECDKKWTNFPAHAKGTIKKHPDCKSTYCGKINILNINHNEIINNKQYVVNIEVVNTNELDINQTNNKLFILLPGLINLNLHTLKSIKIEHMMQTDNMHKIKHFHFEYQQLLTNSGL